MTKTTTLKFPGKRKHGRKQASLRREKCKHNRTERRGATYSADKSSWYDKMMEHIGVSSSYIPSPPATPLAASSQEQTILRRCAAGEEWRTAPFSPEGKQTGNKRKEKDQLLTPDSRRLSKQTNTNIVLSCVCSHCIRTTCPVPVCCLLLWYLFVNVILLKSHVKFGWRVLL